MIITLCYKGRVATFRGDGLEALLEADRKVVEWQSE